MNSCADCNQNIDSQTGLLCIQCRVPICIANCFKNHSTHKFQNLSPSNSSEDMLSKVMEAEKMLSDLSYQSGTLIEIIRTMDNEVANHALKLANLRQRIGRNTQYQKNILDSFHERHNNVLRNLNKMHQQMIGLAKDSYKFWGNIAAYNYDEISSVRYIS